ncbi:hypothetical protein PAXRUDRAFT_171940 [Paxillus rubicundulus Ve08.2h10]|uniref:Unplaced genomic scaffold scaffold_3090, whole genome shotgun sequence n=1 Tax=Paxillus rubicundulus Ve08.2h10 TaxID=930991 RepID=A0A0D0CKG6_9AGAM|nr:hypothetical protein PAXRUDRAFT_171940 [Paxillus rubicundulus Ve08.2h10]
MPNAIFNILSIELPQGAETFHMTFKPKYPGPLVSSIFPFPAIVNIPVIQLQNGLATIEQQTVPIGSGSSAIVTTYPVPDKHTHYLISDPLNLSATKSESKPSTPQLFLKLLKSVWKVQGKIIDSFSVLSASVFNH